MLPFHLPDETRVRHVHLRTANLASVLEFYQRVTGLLVIARSPLTVTLSATGMAPAILMLTEDPNAVRRLFHISHRLINLLGEASM